jgi:hypothetical protein
MEVCRFFLVSFPFFQIAARDSVAWGGKGCYPSFGVTIAFSSFAQCAKGVTAAQGVVIWVSVGDGMFVARMQAAELRAESVLGRHCAFGC